MSLLINEVNILISEIRKCESSEQELKLVETEKRKITSKLAGDGLDSERLKKYIWKLLYIKMLGYSIPNMESNVRKLLNSDAFSHKYTAYVALSFVIRHTPV